MPVRDEMWDPIDPVLFEQSLRFLQKHFHVISLSELLFNPPLSTRPLAAITFDDGYHDYIDYALPLLDKYKMNSSLFVIADCIDKNLPTWTYIVDYYFSQSGKLTFNDVDLSGLDEQYQVKKWNSKQERIDYCKKFKQYIKSIPGQRRDSIINDMIRNFNDIESPEGIMVTWDEIKQVKAAGHEIGSHSVSHPTLVTLGDDDLINAELKNSAERIAQQTGIIPRIFSYPIGSYNQRVKQLTKDAGYKAALAVNEKPYNPKKEDLFEVPRIQLYNESWAKTKLRMNGAITLLKSLRK